MNHLSTLSLHQLRYGELDQTRTDQAQQHLANCPDCRDRFEAQQQQREAFVLSPVPSSLQRPSPRTKRWVWLPLAVAAAAALLVALPPPPEVRTKGSTEVVLFVEGRGALVEGAPVGAGDRIQISVPVGPWRHAWVSDGASILGSFSLSNTGSTLSPFSLELDDSGSDELLVVVLAPHHLENDQLKKIIEGNRMDGVVVTSLVLPRAQ